MTCKNCGAEIPENAKFCPKCGASNNAEEMNVSAAGSERAVPRGFSSKKNIIIFIIAAVLLIGGGVTAFAVVNSHSASSGITDKLQLAERYLSEQNYEQAIIEYQKILEIEPYSGTYCEYQAEKNVGSSALKINIQYGSDGTDCRVAITRKQYQ